MGRSIVMDGADGNRASYTMHSVVKHANTLIHVVVPMRGISYMAQMTRATTIRRALIELAAMTGGEPHALDDDAGPDDDTDKRIVDTFRRILDIPRSP